jgi:hypothetical protein
MTNALLFSKKAGGVFIIVMQALPCKSNTNQGENNESRIAIQLSAGGGHGLPNADRNESLNYLFSLNCTGQRGTQKLHSAYSTLLVDSRPIY